jgi:UDP-3-O-acyl-N-acetylglucosamine deacetylase
MHADVEMRFYGDEPARHALMDVMGDLALLGDKGNSGIPCGHVIAFNAGHDLVMDFIIHCAEAIEAGDIQEFPFMLLPSEVRMLSLVLPCFYGMHLQYNTCVHACMHASLIA